MYLLDTNVVSELRKLNSNKLDKNVRRWASAVSPAELFLSVTTILELETGILLLERRDFQQSIMLRAWLNEYIFSAFSERILPIDVAVAQRCAKLHVPNPRPKRDAMIAATALVYGMTVVTRNVNDFDQTGVKVINPWN